MRIALLHTSDAHNRWNEAFVSHLRALKAQHDALLLDSGDAIRAGNVAVPLRPEAAWDWMRAAGYDAMTIGNREFHLTAAGFLAKTQGAPCPLLCANLRPQASRHANACATCLAHGASWRARRRTGADRADDYPTHEGRRAQPPYLFDPPLETARLWVQRLRLEADLLIALTHLGIQHDRLLSRGVPRTGCDSRRAFPHADRDPRASGRRVAQPCAPVLQGRDTTDTHTPQRPLGTGVAVTPSPSARRSGGCHRGRCCLSCSDGAARRRLLCAARA
jgi:hypothetical protein